MAVQWGLQGREEERLGEGRGALGRQAREMLLTMLGLSAWGPQVETQLRNTGWKALRHNGI